MRDPERNVYTPKIKRNKNDNNNKSAGRHFIIAIQPYFMKFWVNSWSFLKEYNPNADWIQGMTGKLLQEWDTKHKQFYTSSKVIQKEKMEITKKLQGTQFLALLSVING